MPATLQTSRTRWIDAGLAALATGGPGAVRVEALADALGVTKGGFYGQFADRPAFLVALLEEWERRSIDHVLAQVDDAGGDAKARILQAGRLTFAAELLPTDLAIRAWARTDTAAAAALRRVDDRRLAYLRSQFATITSDPDEIEARSILALTLAIGQHFTAWGGDDRDRRQALDLAAAFIVSDLSGARPAQGPPPTS